MPFTVFVAVDLAGGRVVRLVRGDMADATVYGDDPVEVALGWEAAGAGWLHVVDLDGATAGEPRNAPAVRRILGAVRVPVQVSGGVRSVAAAETWLDAGARRVVAGTRALDPAFLAEAVPRLGDALVAAVDAREGRVRVSGWTRASDLSPVEAARRLAEAGVARLLFTDIGRDGTLAGPNVTATAEVLEAAGVPVIASGGVGSEEDVRALAALAPRGLEGVVVGKALYSGALTLDRALAAAGR